MTFFAKINSSSIVTNTIYIDDSIEASNELKQSLSTNPEYVEFNEEISVAPNFTYDSSINQFLPPRPYASWTWDSESLLWIPPTPIPNSEEDYVWNENIVSWELT